MTRADLVPYWSAIAQVIPVLALAFVIEARLVVRQLSSKAAFRRRKSRVLWSVTFFLVSTGLILSELSALQLLASDPERQLTVIERVYFVVSVLTTVATLYLVLSIPIGNMVWASTLDVNQWIRMHWRWGNAQRLRREIVADIKELELEVRKNKAAQLPSLMAASQALREPLPRADLEKAVRAQLGPRDPKDKPWSLEMWDELDTILSHRDDPNYSYNVGLYFYNQLKAHEKRIQSEIKRKRKLIHRVDKIVASSPKGYEKAIRRIMAETARTA